MYNRFHKYFLEKSIDPKQFSFQVGNWPRNYSIWRLNIWSFGKHSVYAGRVYWYFNKLFK